MLATFNAEADTEDGDGVQDDVEAQTEDTDSTADGDEADGDMDNDGEPDGSEADTEADTEDGDDTDDYDEEDLGELGMEVTTDASTPSPESGKDVSATELPDNCVMVNASDIDMTYAQGMDSDQFWNHHGNTKEDYMRIAEGIPDVQQALDSGKSLDEIKQDPDLKDTAHAYFDPENMIKVEQQADGSYSFADDGRHRIAAAQELGYEIPVQVTNLPENANASAADVKPEGTATAEDVANKSDISSETRENLGAFEQNNWDNLSQVEKEQAVENLRDSIAKDLQLENKPNIAYYNNEKRPVNLSGELAQTGISLKSVEKSDYEAYIKNYFDEYFVLLQASEDVPALMRIFYHGRYFSNFIDDYISVLKKKAKKETERWKRILAWTCVYLVTAERSDQAAEELYKPIVRYLRSLDEDRLLDVRQAVIQDVPSSRCDYLFDEVRRKEGFVEKLGGFFHKK